LFINDKYYIFSIIAIFLTLGIGIFIGITINENDVFNQEQKNLIDKLELEFSYLREKNKLYQQEISALNAHLKSIENFLEKNIEQILENRLMNKKIAFIEINETTICNEIIKKIEASGAEVIGRKILFETDLSSNVVESVSLDDYFSGKPDHIIIIRDSSQTENSEKVKEICLPFIDSLKANNINVICIENDITLLEEYKKMNVTTIDNIESIYGQISLVLSIEGNCKGHYGINKISEKLLPD